MMRLNLAIDPDLESRSPRKHISERRIWMAESEWAKGMVQEFKVGRTRKAEEDAMLLEDKQEGIAFELRTDAKNFDCLAIWICCGGLLQSFGWGSRV